jgi:ribonuclease G
MKSILVNVMPEETRMAIIADEGLIALEVERGTHSHLVGNIYKGHVQNVLPGMQAAFVDIGWKKNAFLYIGDGMPHDVIQSLPKTRKIHIGQNLLVQIVKDANKLKGPRATMHLSLPGRNVVLMPTASYIGISRRIEDEEERARLRIIAEKLCPPDMGLIIRTAAAGQSEEALASDVHYLVRLWDSLMARNKLASAPALLYRDADLIIRIVRDSFTDDVNEMIVDDPAVYQRVKELLQYISPQLVERVKLYTEKQPLFRRYELEDAINHIGDREVDLQSGGFLIIDKTEALTIIDVNTGKYVGKANLADTVYRTNLEAAAEILRQIRLRDIGGIILIDFIDMETEAQKETLLEYMRGQVKEDRRKTNIVDITSLGLVEITRKKSRQNVEGIIYHECPICHGRGRIESAETVGIKICRELRRIEGTAHAASGYEITLYPQVAQELEGNGLLKRLQEELKIVIKLRTDSTLHPESYTIMQLN